MCGNEQGGLQKLGRCHRYTLRVIVSRGSLPFPAPRSPSTRTHAHTRTQRHAQTHTHTRTHTHTHTLHTFCAVNTGSKRVAAAAAAAAKVNSSRELSEIRTGRCANSMDAAKRRKQHEERSRKPPQNLRWTMAEGALVTAAPPALNSARNTLRGRQCVSPRTTTARSHTR